MASEGAPNVIPIRLGIVDDHPVIATAIAAAVDAEGEANGAVANGT